MSASGEVPMYRKTPNRTGMGIYVRMGVMKTDRPIITEIIIKVILCSLYNSIENKLRIFHWNEMNKF
jgi:hypothetical protein